MKGGEGMKILWGADQILKLCKALTLKSLEEIIMKDLGIGPDNKVFVIGGILYDSEEETQEKVHDTLLTVFRGCYGNHHFVSDVIAGKDIVVAYELD
ncbi:MAG: hypothetical protein WC694_00565 [Candidatus Paceibacterota bacterium]|jgi:hypothetical protein